ncbi:penicillin amidase [Glycocaulis alkaliphilus]|uniref:Penicillin amidase n=1 Tax=Glycocaulis alkaliphilus TaxID=1434191 RepID=A0A3T0ECP4_9PROT|nr:penicillin acylase family protein [Glycocaulis alkaliphilus]AZU05072.1 penicillin amidase [Glycocaulis alkaliphilus]GGB65446.1 penicillin acylase [Glycocaulis alkaliphilus]
MVKWIVRSVIGVVALVLVLVLAVTGWAGWRFVGSQPRLEGEVRLEGVTAPVNVVRDQYGVAHIFGETDADVYFALGYTHAAERFFQMDLYRRTAQGRLSELFGERALRADIRARTFGFPEATRHALANLSDEARLAIEAYVSGVNARLEQGNPAPEYLLLRTRPEPWTLADSASVMIVLADDLAAGEGEDRERARASQVLEGSMLEQFLAAFPDWGPTTLKDEDINAAFGDIRRQTLPPPAGTQPDNEPGSNAWVVSGDRTETGAPLLANDPHLGLSAPSIWYFTRLNLSFGPVLGASLPGTPFITLGRNAHGAWGFTNTGFKVIDLVERDSDTTQTNTRIETINVLGQRDPFELTITETSEGPVLDAQWFDLTGFDSDALVVRRSTVSDPGNRVADATLAIMRSTGWDDFVEAGRGWTAPMQNMHYAGVDGTIGYTTAGLLPMRDEDGEWTGFVPFEELPRIANPAGGSIASGNNLPAGAAYPYPLPGRYGVHRAVRIETMLAERRRHSLEGFITMQMDVTSALAEAILPALLAAQPESELGLEALARLEGWNASLDADGPEGLVLSAWLRVMTEAIWADELGPMARYFRGPRPVFVQDVLTGDASSWCNNVTTTQVETCPVIAGLALDTAMAELARTNGSDMSRWRWGDHAQGYFAHPMDGLPVLGDMFSVRAPVGGDGTTVNVASFSYAGEGFDIVHAASLRVVYDLADLNNSRFIHGPGQSGHPLSPHYRDLVELWSRGEYFQIRDDWTPDSTPQGSRVLTLRPR